MNKDKREGWLKELKVGDEIAIESASFGYVNYDIKKIEKISPTGRITINGTIYDHNGREMGIADIWKKQYKLVHVTQDIKDYIRKKDLYSKIKNVRWSEISLTNLEEIVKILKLE